MHNKFATLKSYLACIVNYCWKKILFKKCCRIEIAAIEANLHHSDLPRFEILTANTCAAQERLKMARKSLIDARIRISRRPWRKKFEEELSTHLGCSVPDDVLLQLAYFYYIMNMNRLSNFYSISIKLADQAKGDIVVFHKLLEVAAKDFRDVVNEVT